MTPSSDTELRMLLEQLISSICGRATVLQLDGSFAEHIGPLVDHESLEAKSAEQLLIETFASDERRLLDFGCGAMHHRPFIEGIGYEWHGVDYANTFAATVANQEPELGRDVKLYDGRKLPFDDAVFDVVWAMLVLQHLQHIDLSFGEIARVLRRGGKVIGQVAYLEQVQDWGTFNFTPYGMKVAAAENGLELVRIYPKHDAFSFLARRLLITLGSADDTPFNEMLNPDGYFHRKLQTTGQRLGLRIAEINLLRLMFCTHYVFELVR